MKDIIMMAHGSGGRATQRLLDEVILPEFNDPELERREDQAVFRQDEFLSAGDRLAFTTDSYVIDPIFFPGGDIGKLAVCGTANDLVVGGAVPRYLSCGFILEEGFAMDALKRVVESMSRTARKAGIRIVTGDTKVVQRGAADKIFINTAGIGVIPDGVCWSASCIREGDVVIVSGTVGDHGATILNLRENLGMSLDLTSDCAVLKTLLAPVRFIKGVRAVRDATRGGVNGVLQEYARLSGLGVEIDESSLPIKPVVRGVCELLGLDAIDFANEGKVILVVSPSVEHTVLSALKRHPLGKDAAVIGRICKGRGVKLMGVYGVSRWLELPHAEPMPRIC